MASVYFDAVRALAAIVVVLGHAGYLWHSQGIAWLPGNGGHEMVVVFFVLSGFVIAWSTDRKRSDWRVYASDRLSRLYSVALPALMVTALLDRLGMLQSPAIYASQVAQAGYWVRHAVAAAFAQQAWTLCVKPGSNTPFWSLAYEFWYYALFAVLIYLRGTARVCATILWLAAVGWKIPLLLPVWLLGVAAYFAVKRIRASRVVGAAIAAGSGGLFVMIVMDWITLPFLVGPSQWAAVPPLYFSGNFGTDYFHGLLVALHFFGMAVALNGTPAGRGWGVRVCRYLADRSFSLYALHFPLLLFVATWLSFDHDNSWHVAGVLAVVFAIAFGIGGPMENSRFAWRRVTDRLLGARRASVPRNVPA